MMQLLEQSGSILNGHFLLSSGLHSRQYIQCAKLFVDPAIASQVCSVLAIQIKDAFPGTTMLVSPAMGGILVGYETSHHLGVKNVFVERVNNIFELRRGFEISRHEKIVIVEDVITTGKSTIEAINVVKQYGAEILGVASIIDRTSSAFQYKIASTIKINIETYSESNLPDDLATIPAIKPGSRKMDQSSSVT